MRSYKAGKRKVRRSGASSNLVYICTFLTFFPLGIENFKIWIMPLYSTINFLYLLPRPCGRIFPIFIEIFKRKVRRSGVSLNLVCVCTFLRFYPLGIENIRILIMPLYSKVNFLYLMLGPRGRIFPIFIKIFKHNVRRSGALRR